MAAVLLLAALFLVHGLQCAAASEHGPGAMSHTPASPAPVDGVMHDSALGNESAVLMLVAPLHAPVGNLVAPGGSGRAGSVCAAVLTALGVWLLSRQRAPLFSRGARVLPAGGLSVQLRTAARLRLPPLDLAVLCVLRT